MEKEIKFGFVIWDQTVLNFSLCDSQKLQHGSEVESAQAPFQDIKRQWSPRPLACQRLGFYRLGMDSALAAEVEWSSCRRRGKSPNSLRHKPASAHSGVDITQTLPRGLLGAICGHRQSSQSMGNPGQCWSPQDSGHSAVPVQHILPQCSLSPDTTCCHLCFTLSHVALYSEALARLMQNLLIFVNSKLLWKTFLFSKQCPLLLFFACISPQLPPNPVLVKQGWRYFGHVFTLLMYTCLVSFHFPSDYTLLHKCSHLAQHHSFFLSTPE